MKGVVLAGGLGTRLYPLTLHMNKHFLPVYDKPMIYYPIEMMIEAGIQDIMIVTGGEKANEFERLIGKERAFADLHISFAYQEKPDGIASALGKAEDFVGQDKMVVILGDNLLQNGIKKGVEAFQTQEMGSRVFLKEVVPPRELGFAEVDGNRISRIVEKPVAPPSNLAVIGVYMYPPDVFSIIKNLTLSNKGEYEITDVNNIYVERGEMKFDKVDGWWIDAGENHEALLKASLLIARQKGLEV